MGDLSDQRCVDHDIRWEELRCQTVANKTENKNHVTYDLVAILSKHIRLLGLKSKAWLEQQLQEFDPLCQGIQRPVPEGLPHPHWEPILLWSRIHRVSTNKGLLGKFSVRGLGRGRQWKRLETPKRGFLWWLAVRSAFSPRETGLLDSCLTSGHILQWGALTDLNWQPRDWSVIWKEYSKLWFK